jgi:cytidyltransferase-like protein
MDEIMNLGQYLVQQLLEAENQPTIALFPGAFKPPHKGHFAVVKKLLEKADQVVVLISPKTREGVTVDESLAIWELYKTLLDGNVEVRVASGSPVQEAYRVAKDNPDTKFILACR